MSIRGATPTALVLALALAAAFVGRPAATPPAASSDSTPAARSAATSASTPRAAATSPVGATARPSPAPAAAPARLGEEAAEQVLAQLALRQLADEQNLWLTEPQWAALASTIAHFQAVRHAYEASIATVEAAGPDRYRIEIPAYGDAGAALQAALHEELHHQLGAIAAEQVSLHLKSALEGVFAGFGLSAQTLEFAGSDPAEALVLRTAAYWKGSVENGRLTTRREAHLPAAEDPTGLQWAPFFALIARQG